MTDIWSSYDLGNEMGKVGSEAEKYLTKKNNMNWLWWLLGILGALILAGILAWLIWWAVEASKGMSAGKNFGNMFAKNFGNYLSGDMQQKITQPNWWSQMFQPGKGGNAARLAAVTGLGGAGAAALAASVAQAQKKGNGNLKAAAQEKMKSKPWYGQQGNSNWPARPGMEEMEDEEEGW